MASFTVTDTEAYEAYRAAIVPILQAHGCDIIVADYASEAVEGTPNTATVVLEFASKAAARAWYDSPEYQAIIPLRTANSEGAAVVLVDKWTPPG